MSGFRNMLNEGGKKIINQDANLDDRKHSGFTGRPLRLKFMTVYANWTE